MDTWYEGKDTFKMDEANNDKYQEEGFGLEVIRIWEKEISENLE